MPWTRGAFLTIFESRQTDLQPEECRYPMLRLQCSYVQVIVTFEPDLPHGLKPRGREHFDIFSSSGDIAIFVAVDAADDEVGYV